MADNTKGWQNHNIHFGMTKEPEQVQEQDRIAAALWNEEGCAKVTVGQQHGDSARQDRHSQQQQKCGDQHCPCK